MATIDSSYLSKASALGITFSVTPARSPLHGFSFSLAILTLIAAAAASGYAVPLIFFWLIYIPYLGPLLQYVVLIASFLALWIGAYKWVKGRSLRLQTAARHANPVELLVTSEGIRSADGKIALTGAGIHRLVMMNSYDQSVDLPVTGMVVAGNATMVGAAVAANAVTNAAFMVANMKLKALARISYLVTAEAGGVSHVLAGGMTEVCARGLMTDIEKALQA